MTQTYSRFMIIMLAAATAAVGFVGSVSFLPSAMALEDGEYIIFGENDSINLVITVDVAVGGGSETFIEDVFYEEGPLMLSHARITPDGEKARIFGHTESGQHVYVLVELHSDGGGTIKTKVWDDPRNRSSFVEEAEIVQLF